MAVLFVEISCEEIPARMQNNAIKTLAQNLTRLLSEKGFQCGDVRTAISPRHMAIEIVGLAEQLADSATEKRGPRLSAPDQAIDGFCQSAGLSRDELEVRKTDKGEFYFAILHSKGVSLTEVLPSLLQQLIEQFPWPKSQRWGKTTLSWVRPLHQLAATVDGHLIEGELHLAPDLSQPYASHTKAHPFHGAKDIALSSFDAYLADMKAGYVMVDHTVRKNEIATQLQKCADDKSLKLVPDDRLLDEITGLVEWPHALCGQIDDTFMSLPSEVLITSMRVHQKFFALRAEDNAAAAPYFITVANRQPTAETAQLITQGNERVLRARLADAAFFWEQDKAVSFEDYLPKLEQVTFYENLGSMRQKADRISALAKMLAPTCGSDVADAERAGLLAKADLVTGMVGEFPELQGIMGGYYAAHHGENKAVSDAISEHYRPQGPEDELPQSTTGLAVALADKIDTLVGFFGVGEKPTGSRDPFALRRAALGILRIMDEASIALNLSEIFAKAAALHGFNYADDELEGFMADRLRVNLRDKNIAHDIVACAMSASAAAAAQDDLLWKIRLASLLQEQLASTQGQDMLAAYRRFSSLLAAEQKKAELPAGEVDPACFEHDAENTLYKAVAALPAYKAGDAASLIGFLAALAALKAPINAYFEGVVVNADQAEIRDNRLRMLNNLNDIFTQIADLSLLEGQ